MYRKILVPLDGSGRAEQILPHIEMLAKCMQAHVILLRVYRPDYGGSDTVVVSPDYYQTITINCRENAIAYLTTVQERLTAKGLQVSSLAEEGDVVNTILSIADREGVDLISMSSHGRTGLAQVFYGSVAAGVLHKVDRPLLLVRAEN